MGADIHVRIVYRDKNEWKPAYLFYQDKHKIKVVNPYPFRNYEAFDILSGNEHKDFPCTPIFKKDLPKALLNHINESENTLGYYGFREVNLADLKIYLQKHPTVIDWEEEWEGNNPVYKENPIADFVKRIEAYLDFVEPWWDDLYSNIRIIYWFDR